MSVASQLEQSQIRERIQERQQQALQAQSEEAETRYRYVRPLLDAATSYIDYAQNPEGRFRLGLTEVDMMTRGFGRGELVYVAGRAHAGKTQVVLTGVANNPDRRVLIFTPDEPAELVLAKLVAIRHGINAEDLEARIRARDEQTVELVRRTATHDFGSLVVVDESLTTGQMHDALREAQDMWGERCDAVVIDYLELIPGGDNVDAKSQQLKRWTKQADVPVLCLHQSSRSGGTRGQAAGMDGMRYGGQNEAIFVLEVFRRRDDESLDEWERRQHQDRITVSVSKNKRPPGKTGQVDFYLHPDTGLIRPLQESDMAMFSPAHRTAYEARGVA